MTTPKKPELTPETANMTFDRMLCLRHGEPFKAEWPSGYPSFICVGFKKYTDSGGMGKLPEDKVERARAMEVHFDLSPLCCRLGPDRLFDVYMEIQRDFNGPWKKKLCLKCGRLQYGGPYRSSRTEHGGGIVLTKHVCLSCVCFRTQRVTKRDDES